MNSFFRSFLEIRKFNQIDSRYKKIVFFSENNSYSYFFKNIVDGLIEKNIKLTFVTADKKDFFLNYNNQNIKTILIPNFLFLQFFFSNLKCENLILTMPDLGSGIINKSPFCKKYIYIFHSLISITVAYKEKSFDNYDVFFSPSVVHTEEIKKKFDGMGKEIIKIGYPKIEELKNKISYIKETSNILIAPTWGSDSSLYSEVLLDLINYLIKKDFTIIFRPHPMSFKKDKKKIEEIVSKFKWYEKFKLNSDNNNNNVFLEARILITDWSGAGMEFSMSKEKPSLFIDTKQRIRNNSVKQGDKILETTFEYFSRNELGIILNKENIINIENIIKDFERNAKVYENKIRNFKNKYLYNNGKSLEKTILSLMSLSD
tara:strand:+ start:1706 stop:2824 length:1119 start_codon:yes stop_codon:yes gene_type:complete